MSAEPTLVTAQHFEYLSRRTAGDDAFLADLKRAAAEAGIPAIWVAPSQASFMQVLLRIAGAREVLEVGTLAGYSAIVMARALPDGGRVRTIEIDERHADFAREWIARSDVADKVEVLHGSGQDVLPTLEAGTVDALFLDADKSGYRGYVEHGRRLLRPRGLVMVDNAFAFGQLFSTEPSDGEVPAVRAFNDWMAEQADIRSVIVPLGDGLWVGVTDG